MKYVLYGLLALVGLFVLGWVSGINQIAWQRFSAPQYEQIRRDTFRESQAFNEGAQRELNAMMVDYSRATPSQRSAVGTMILHQQAAYPEDQLPEHMRVFIRCLRSHQADTYNCTPGAVN